MLLHIVFSVFFCSFSCFDFLILGATQMYNFPEELREVVNDHWSQFPPQHPLVADIFGILFFVLTVVNFIANSLVIYVYLGTEELKTPVRISKKKKKM